MKYLILVLMLLSEALFAQYDSTMYDLIKTTYERKFDKSIINSYLKSESDKKIKAALLSISQSEDTSFIPILLKLDHTLFGNEILFAIGQIGYSKQSIEFLWDYLSASHPISQYPNIYFAIGKIGDENDLDRLVDFYESHKTDNSQFNGIADAILQFQLRGIKNERAKGLLINEILNEQNDLSRQAGALFTITRYGSSEKIINKLIDILAKPLSTKSQFSEIADSLERLEIALKQFAFMNFQRLKYFPSNHYKPDNNLQKYHFITGLFLSNDILSNLELAKSIVYLNFEQKHTSFLPLVLKLLDDSNLNVALQIANSAANIDSNSLTNRKSFIHQRLNDVLFDLNKDNRLKSEWFLTCYKILGDYKEFSRLLKTFDADDKLRIRFAAQNPDTSQAVSQLIEFYNSKNLNNKIESLTYLSDFSHNKKYSDGVATIILDAITSSYPPLNSIAADGLDSSFIFRHKKILKELISIQIVIFKDNPKFIESIISLLNLSEKIDKNFFNQMLERANSSSLYSLRKFTASLQKSKTAGFKEPDHFDEIWEYVFKYRGANVYTNQGSFTINFDWESVPITAANFCKLASDHFYDGIIFHRVVPGFVIQAGDPTQTGWGGPGYDIVSEFSDTKYDIGKVGMASAGKDTEGSQFFVMQGNYPHLNRRYSLFADVTVGLRTVYEIAQGDKIISIQLIK